MNADRRLEIAGLAADALDRKGFVSVARLRDGVVTLEWWKVVGKRQYHMRRVVTDADTAPDDLAETCASELRSIVSPQGSS